MWEITSGSLEWIFTSSHYHLCCSQIIGPARVFIKWWIRAEHEFKYRWSARFWSGITVIAGLFLEGGVCISVGKAMSYGRPIAVCKAINEMQKHLFCMATFFKATFVPKAVFLDSCDYTWTKDLHANYGLSHWVMVPHPKKTTAEIPSNSSLLSPIPWLNNLWTAWTFPKTRSYAPLIPKGEDTLFPSIRDLLAQTCC